MPATNASENRSNARLRVVIALIGLAATLGSGILANWDKIFRPRSRQDQNSHSRPVLGGSGEKREAPTPLPEGAALGYHVIVASSYSQEDAIAQARNLRALGYQSGVVLSTADVYGVTLGSYDSAPAARDAKERAQALHHAPRDAYVLPPARVKALVFR